MNGYRIVVSALVVYPHDSMTNWELWLDVTDHHQEILSYHILLAQEEIKIQNLKYGLYNEVEKL